MMLAVELLRHIAKLPVVSWKPKGKTRIIVRPRTKEGLKGLNYWVFAFEHEWSNKDDDKQVLHMRYYKNGIATTDKRHFIALENPNCFQDLLDAIQQYMNDSCDKCSYNYRLGEWGK